MQKILVLNSSPDLEGSLSRKMVNEFVNKLSSKYPEAKVAIRDLASSPLPYVDQARINVFNKKKTENLSSQEITMQKLGNELVDELLNADIVVVGAPVYNFSIPAQLKTWIDHIVMAGRTYAWGENGPYPLVSDRPVYVMTASGFGYEGFGDWSSKDVLHHKQFLQDVFAYIGIQSIHFIDAVGRSEESVKHAFERMKDLIDNTALQA